MSLGVSLLMMAAVGLIAASTCQFLAIGIASGRACANARGRRAADLRGLRQAAQVARLNSELQSSQASVGVSWRVMEVAEFTDESADCRSFYLVDPYRQPLPTFLPGQHLMVRPALAGAYQTLRCYSLSSAPDPRYWRITVKRQAAAAPSNGSVVPLSTSPSEGGLSVWLHSNIGVGDCLLVGGPNGHFHLDPQSDRPLVLLAAGVGVTPIASMLRWSMQHTPQRPVRLLYQAKDLQHWPLGPALHHWTRQFPSCRVTSFFSRVSQAELFAIGDAANVDPPFSVEHRGELVSGKLDVHRALQASDWHLGDPVACDYYLCGPNRWMEDQRQALLTAGIPAGQIHWESFGAASSPTDSSAPVSQQPATKKCQIHFAVSEVTAESLTGEQSLWEIARANSVAIPSGCLSGVCGCCRVKLLSGSVSYDREHAIELAEDECLACIARPQSDCGIDV